nr:putative zinc finger, CCHC-type, retrotransposon Gag domain protein [Tanacetum cinerariifolium]
EEDEENEDADIEEDDDAEIIFPYEVQGDQTPPPKDESYDSNSELEAEEGDDEPEAEDADDEPEAEDANDELEVEEAGVEPEAKGADVELEAEEPDGVPNWRHYVDMRGLGRLSRRQVGLSVKETLGKVVERLKVLESEENATLRKKLAEKEVLLDLTRMKRDRAEKRLSESIRWNKGFYLEMVRKGAIPKLPSDEEGSKSPRKTSKKSDGDERPSDPRGSLKTGGPGGASGSGGGGGSGGTGGNADGTGFRGTGPTVPELTGCTYATFIKCDPLPFNVTEGAVGLCQWFERLESVFQISECIEKDRVKFAMATLRGRALTWWNERTKAMGIEAANNTPWSKVKK